MTPPDAQTVHPGHTAPPEGRRELICAWLEANGINPEDVVATRPVYVLAVPNGTIQGGIPWLIDVIVVHQFYRNPDGYRERDYITGDAVMFQRTVPLKVPFPADPTTDDEGSLHGEEPEVQPAQEDQRPAEHEGGPEGDEQQAVRAAQAEEVQDRRSGPREERPGKGGAARVSGAEEGRSKGRDEEVPEPEEVRRRTEEEVT